MSLERRTPLRRTGIARGTTELRRTRLRPVSARKRAKDAVLAENREAALTRDRWSCQAAAALPTPCDGGLHAHHVLPRSRGGPHDVENLLTVCGFHHQHIHDHPAEAKALGFLR